LEELPLEDVQLVDGYAAHSGVEIVGAENIAEALAGDGDGCDNEAVAGERRKREERHASADLVNVMECDQETSFLCVGRKEENQFRHREESRVGSTSPPRL
jgi:hypothetical protein